MSDRPDPKSFDTLEKAQAEIARLYALDDALSGPVNALIAMLPEIEEAQRETRPHPCRRRSPARGACVMAVYASPVSWRDMDRRSRAVWFNDHGDRFAQARGKLAQAVEAFARECVECGALENNNLTAEQVLNDIMDTADGVLAEEVQRWVGV